MIEESAIVVEADGERALVSTQRRTSCGTCEASKTCGTPVLAKVIGNRLTQLEVENPIQAKPGDQVIIGLQESALLQVSLLFYILPLLTLFAGGVIGELVAGFLGFEPAETLSIVCGLLGLTIGLYLVRRISRQNQYNRRYQAVILRHDKQSKMVQLS